jgi:hypothetical protein
MRDIRWQVGFKNRSGQNVRVDIYEEDWSGGVTALTPSEQPFETDEDDADDIMAPVRTQSGYIRVIDEGNLDGLVPTHASQHYVECNVAGSCVWCGYMKPDVYTAEWQGVKSEAEFPVISGLGYLDGMYLDPQKDMGIVTFRELIYECLENAGIEWEYVYMPREFSNSADASYPYTFPLYLEISRYNFFEQTDADYMDETEQRYESETCLTVLEEFAKFFGWTLIERGHSIYFISTESVDYIRFSYARLKGGIMYYEKWERNAMQLKNLTWRGADHSVDKVQGYTKITVEADMNPVEESVIQVDKENLSRETTMKVLPQSSSDNIRKLYLRVYGEGGESAGVVFNQYDREMDSSQGWIYYQPTFDAEKIMDRIGAAFVSYQLYKVTDEEGMKNYSLSDAILVTAQGKTAVGRYSLPTEKTYEAVRLTNKQIAQYLSGAFVISANVTAIYNDMYFDKRNGGGKLDFKLRAGEKWWDGESWSSTECTFKIAIGSDDSTNVVDDADGQILNTKTLDMPYNGADGYVIPITEAVSGEIELSIMVPHVGDEGSSVAIWFFFKSLKLEYYIDDGDWTKNATDRKSNKYKTLIDLFSEEKEVKLAMGTDKNNGACYGTLMYGGSNITQLYDEATGEMIRPEYALLNKLKKQYGVMKERLTLTVKYGAVTPLSRFAYNGKQYMVTGESIRFADQEMELTLMEV